VAGRLERCASDFNNCEQLLGVGELRCVNTYKRCIGVKRLKRCRDKFKACTQTSNLATCRKKHRQCIDK
jgi:hypothetical protein